MYRKHLMDSGCKTRQIRTCHKKGKVGDPEVQSRSCSSVPSPTRGLPFQVNSLQLQGGYYFTEGQPPWQSDFGGHNEPTTFYLEADGLSPGVDLLGPLCSTKAFSLINKLSCSARVVFSHTSRTALHLCAETSCRHSCRQT